MTDIPLPSYHRTEEFQNRCQKLQEWRALGIDPYPHLFHPTHVLDELEGAYKDREIGDSEKAAAAETDSARIAGRLVLFRAMGKNAFAHLQGATGRLQVMFNRDLTQIEGLSPEALAANGSVMKILEKKLDLGDFVGVEGHLFRTHKGELTLFAKKVTLLCKSLLPLPDKHSGLADKETRYRKRWLDLIAHPEVMETFLLRSKILRILRRYFEAAGFLEVETPTLENTYGGASARPFTTHLNALDQEMFLRISLEIPLKKLIVGGISKVYEIGKVFRNEGIDRSHNPEFTELEVYAAYWDYNDMMAFTEKMYETVALELFGTTQIPYGTRDDGTLRYLELKAPWKRMTMAESIHVYGGHDITHLSDNDLRHILRSLNKIEPLAIDKASRGGLVAMLFDELVVEHLEQPHHITDHPIETTPLCKLHRDPHFRAQGIVERFESFLAGCEACNAYTELNDPILQRELLEEQARKRDAGDEEACPLDEEFLEAVCQGMPPTSGMGFGVDRLVMLFANAQSIRDILFFPLMRR